MVAVGRMLSERENRQSGEGQLGLLLVTVQESRRQATYLNRLLHPRQRFGFPASFFVASIDHSKAHSPMLERDEGARTVFVSA